MPKILLVEDNPDLAFGIAKSLEVEGFEVVTAADGPSGVEQARKLRPDLIILDLMLPGFDGYQVLTTVRSEDDSVPVMILTARGDEPNKLHGFRLGADDYVTKPFGVSELIARVRALLRRAHPETRGPTSVRTVEHFGNVTVNMATRVVMREDTQVPLTPKAFDLLVALIKRDGAVATRHDLLRDVWEHRAEVTTRTVDIHIAELRRKLEEDAAEPRYILTVWKVGYRLDRSA
ncbi:MAG: response regulator transcription factor [Gemmatimonadota bacterium]|nr:response regulator transcription factor [Gemmatimonadota bacterium]